MDDHSNKLADPASEVDPSSATFAPDAANELANRAHSLVDRIYARDAGGSTTGRDDSGSLADRSYTRDAGGSTTGRDDSGSVLDRIHAIDAVKTPLSGAYDFDSRPSVQSDYFKRDHTDDLLNDIYAADAMDPSDLPGIDLEDDGPAPLMTEPGEKAVRKKWGPYHYKGKEVVIPRASLGLDEISPTTNELELAESFLPTVCISSGKRTLPMGAIIEQQAYSHRHTQRLAFYTGKQPLLWSCVFLILLLLSEAFGAFFLNSSEGKIPELVIGPRDHGASYKAAERKYFAKRHPGMRVNTWWRVQYQNADKFVKDGPGSLLPQSVLIALGALMLLWVAQHLYFTSERKRMCHVVFGMESGVAATKQQLRYTLGLVCITAGIVLFFLLYKAPYTWILKTSIAPTVAAFGMKLIWDARYPLLAVTIDEKVVHFKGGRFGLLHTEFLYAMDQFPRTWEKPLLRFDDPQDKENLVDWLVRSLTPAFLYKADKALDKDRPFVIEGQSQMALLAAAGDTPRELKAHQRARREEKLAKREDRRRTAGYKEQPSVALSASDQLIDDARPRSVLELARVGQDELTIEIARQFVEGLEPVDLFRYERMDDEAAAVLVRSDTSLYLNGFKKLEFDVAEVLAEHKHGLDLSGLKSLPANVARELSAHKSHLQLNGLTELSWEAAQALAPHRGGISFRGLKSLSPEVAKVLATFKEALVLDGLETLSEDVARAFSGHEESLALNGLTELSEPVAQALARHDGRLDLDGLKSLSPEVANCFADHRGELELDGLTRLSMAQAEALCQHQGDLTLDALESVTVDVAKALAKHQYNLAIGIKELTTIGAAKAFAKHQGNLLSLFNLSDLPLRQAKALAKYPGALMYRPKNLDAKSVEKLKDGGHFMILSESLASDAPDPKAAIRSAVQPPPHFPNPDFPQV